MTQYNIPRQENFDNMPWEKEIVIPAKRKGEHIATRPGTRTQEYSICGITVKDKCHGGRGNKAADRHTGWRCKSQARQHTIRSLGSKHRQEHNTIKYEHQANKGPHRYKGRKLNKGTHSHTSPSAPRRKENGEPSSLKDKRGWNLKRPSRYISQGPCTHRRPTHTSRDAAGTVGRDVGTVASRNVQTHTLLSLQEWSVAWMLRTPTLPLTLCSYCVHHVPCCYYCSYYFCFFSVDAAAVLRGCKVCVIF